MNNSKQPYETPVVETWEVKMESGLLQASVESTRESYGEAEVREWS